MEGLSGKIRFDGAGFRSDFQLDIVELKREGLVRVGRWDPSNGANFTRNYSKISTEVVESLHNKTLIVSTILVSTERFYFLLSSHCQWAGSFPECSISDVERKERNPDGQCTV